MKVFFDTSVLVAAFLEEHDHHQRSFDRFEQADKKRACCAAHSLAELYSILTRLPGKHRLSGEQALISLDSVCERLETIALDSHEYVSAIQEASADGVIGGTIYDALLAECARKARATVILTWNLNHFQRVCRELGEMVETP